MENVLYRKDLQNRWILYLTDFEFARGAEEDGKSCGSPNYVAPELLDSPQTQGTDKADVWSTGILLYAILTNAMLFDGDPCEALSEIRSISQDDIYPHNQEKSQHYDQ